MTSQPSILGEKSVQYVSESFAFYEIGADLSFCAAQECDYHSSTGDPPGSSTDVGKHRRGVRGFHLAADICSEHRVTVEVMFLGIQVGYPTEVTGLGSTCGYAGTFEW